MEVCAVWLARDFLRTAGRPIDIPPCAHDTTDCPPIAEGAEMTTLEEAERRIIHQTREQAIADIGLDRYNELVAVFVEAHKGDPGTIGNPLVLDAEPAVEVAHSFVSGPAINTCAACNLPLWDDSHKERAAN